MSMDVSIYVGRRKTPTYRGPISHTMVVAIKEVCPEQTHQVDGATYITDTGWISDPETLRQICVAMWTQLEQGRSLLPPTDADASVRMGMAQARRELERAAEQAGVLEGVVSWPLPQAVRLAWG